MNMSLDDLASTEALRRRQGPARADHVAARARAARARVHGDLGRRPRGRAARRVRRPVPDEVRRRRAARRRRPTTAARRGCGRARCSPTSASTRSSAGRRREYGFEPTRFDEMRRGAWDIDARVADMDINGVCGVAVLPVVPARLRRPAAHDVARPTTSSRSPRCARTTTGTSRRGAARIPDRFIPNQIPYLRDPDVAADEIRRNAARGFKAVTFSEAPDKLGLPSIHSGYWDPLFAACEETGTVVCLHVGSSGTSPTTSPDAPPEIVAVLFFAYGMYGAVDWLYSKIPVRFPDIKHLPLGRRHRLGRRAPRPARPLLQLPARLPADVARRRAHAERGPAPQLLVLRARRRRRASSCATASASTTSSSSPTTRTPTRRGPTRRRCSCASCATRACPTTRPQRITWQNASELFRHPVPDALQR